MPVKARARQVDRVHVAATAGGAGTPALGRDAAGCLAAAVPLRGRHRRTRARQRQVPQRSLLGARRAGEARAVRLLQAPRQCCGGGAARNHRGYLIADAQSVYEHVYKAGDIIEVGCWAQCRRYFFQSLASEPERAKAALSIIGALFRVERTIAGQPRGKKEQVARGPLPWWIGLFEWSSGVEAGASSARFMYRRTVVYDGIVPTSGSSAASATRLSWWS